MSYKILITDDEEFIVEMAALRLNAEGYQVFEAHSGQEAIETAKKEKPDLILLDIMMPQMDGIVTAEKIHQDADIKNIPILAFSASSDSEILTSLKKMGAIGYISKPYDPEVLLLKIKEVLDSKDK